MGLALHRKSSVGLGEESIGDCSPPQRAQHVTELLFAGDTALVAHSAADTQEILDKFTTAAGDRGLKINASKIEMLHQPPPERLNQPTPAIKLNSKPVIVVIKRQIP